MASKSPGKIINYKLLLVHIVASWFFMYGVFLLAHLLDPKGFEVFTDAGYNNATPVNHLIEILRYSPYVGLIMALVVSLVICIRKQWPMMNAVIVFLISFLLKRFGITGWRFVKGIFLAPGSLFGYPTAMYFFVNGLIMLAIGVAIFFLPSTNRFIAKSAASPSKN